MPTLTVTSETMRLSDSLGYWVRPHPVGSAFILNFGYGGDRSNGSVLTVWQRPTAQSQATGQPGAEQVMTTILATDGEYAGPTVGDPSMEYDIGCAAGDFVAGDTPLVILGV